MNENNRNDVKIIDRGNSQETIMSLNGEILRRVMSYKIERSVGTTPLVTFTIEADVVELLGDFEPRVSPK